MPDLLTHYVVSVLIASRVFRLRSAMVLALAGLLPDVDALLLVHRWVTHSLILALIVGVLILIVTARFSRLAMTYVAVVLSLYAIHIVMDAFISPTPVFWPLVCSSYAFKVNVNGLLSREELTLIPAIFIESAPPDFAQKHLIEGPVISEYGVVIALAVAAALLAEFLARRVGRRV